MESAIDYIDAKARIIRAINRITTFIKASVEFKNDQTNAGKRAKIATMLSELHGIRQCVENDVQVMETSVGKNLAPTGVNNNDCSNSLIDSFDSIYYELAAFSDVFKLSLKPDPEQSSITQIQSISQNNSSIFQLPKRKFPTFSGTITEWQGFEDLFISILSHSPDLPVVEKFEYLKTSLTGEALLLVSHLSLTAANYHSAWKILRTRYGNKRDLARVHLDALITPHTIKSNDANSIKTLLNSILEHTSALDNLEFTTRTWSPILIHMFEKYLDYNLRSRWELLVGDNHRPNLTEFIDFLRSHIRSAEIFSPVQSETKMKGLQSVNWKSRHSTNYKVLTTTIQSPIVSCPICKNPHSIRKCPTFQKKDPNERFQMVKTNMLCINCLGAGHSAATCPSKYKCTSCNKSHHSMLHFTNQSTLSTTSTALVRSDTEPTENATSLIVRGSPKKIVLLATAILEVYASDGSRQMLRALLDCGSQASFITEKAACALMLQRYHSPVNVTTFANTSTLVCGKCTIKIVPSGLQTPSFCLDVSIVPHITGITPQTTLMSGHWDHIENLQLADPTYNQPGAIDLLLGADLLPSIYTDGMHKGQDGEPLAMNTVFGWVLMGPTDPYNRSSITSLCLSISEPLDLTLKKFWELEELPIKHHLSPDDVAAENIYQETTTRLKSGRFVVNIPFRQPCPILGDSKTLAIQRFKALELRLNRDKSVQKQYAEFMSDYITAGHMELIPLAEKDNPYHYYIPHHCVLKPDSSTTKLRVVFNASAKTSIGISLNDVMYTGPKLQPDIQIVLLRARLWKYLFLADIKQMYRQILVRPTDRDYLRILWRFSPTCPIEEYRLCTVTYGTSAAPFQALRTIRELANVDGKKWPLAASVLLTDTFVDDILTGANTIDAALETQTQLINLCSMAQFTLRKWASNNSNILQTVSEDDRAMSPSILFDSNEQTELKVLGLKWNPLADMFSFKAKSSSLIPTKRTVLSDIARIFDPLGLISPTTFWIKYLLQRLWTSGIGWDDPLPDDIGISWSRFQSELHLIETIMIPRRITHDDAISIQLHAFSDSSEKGYAAAIYLRVETATLIHCQLITGKSKVAPLKKSTIPRLELCGAVIAAKLLNLVKTVYTDRMKIDETHAWTDSTTALTWIRSSPHRWATFVANPTSQIQELTAPSIWRYVPTSENPVDCASRGLFPSDLVNHSLWWTGPSFLKDSPDKWPLIPSAPLQDSTQVEVKKPIVLLVTFEHSIMTLMERFSSLNKILRIVSYCLRPSRLRTSSIQTKMITATEMTTALHALIYYVQQHTFNDDLSRMAKGVPCSKGLRRLDPFVDETRLIRVGGRLENAELPYAHKHPLLLPSNHRLTELLIDHHHVQLKHPGANSLQAILQREFWIMSARKAIRSRLRQCVSCFRTRPQGIFPKMANLPSYRVQQIKPFSCTGVDYAGPIKIKAARGRRNAPNLAYVCLFVCTATKAYHLEMSTDLSTENFLLAFTRFSARRGPILEMHSDCGTNFVGTSKLLTPLQEFTHSADYQQKIHKDLAARQITWHFNPPSSPHFGGLWEAGVKSTKSLILRSIGKHLLTGEELTTLLTQIEATLNSRPLCPVSNDPNDLEALTPSHFLTLQPSTSLPETNLEKVSLSKLQRWRLTNDLHRHFWTRWKNEYLSSLQYRAKWQVPGKQVTVGSLVLIRETTHPLHWRIGRIATLYPGPDGIVRVATVNTTTGKLTRPLVKLCPLPIS